jgi:hypothetical protein
VYPVDERVAARFTAAPARGRLALDRPRRRRDHERMSDSHDAAAVGRPAAPGGGAVDLDLPRDTDLVANLDVFVAVLAELADGEAR